MKSLSLSCCVAACLSLSFSALRCGSSVDWSPVSAAQGFAVCFAGGGALLNCWTSWAHGAVCRRGYCSLFRCCTVRIPDPHCMPEPLLSLPPWEQKGPALSSIPIVSNLLLHAANHSLFRTRLSPDTDKHYAQTERHHAWGRNYQAFIHPNQMIFKTPTWLWLWQEQLELQVCHFR